MRVYIYIYVYIILSIYLRFTVTHVKRFINNRITRIYFRPIREHYLLLEVLVINVLQFFFNRATSYKIVIVNVKKSYNIMKRVIYVYMYIYIFVHTL